MPAGRGLNKSLQRQHGQPLRRVQAVANFRQRGFCDVEKMRLSFQEICVRILSTMLAGTE